MLTALFAYVGGLLVGHSFAESFQYPFPAFVFLISLFAFLLIAILFFPERVKISLLLALFFILGIVLDLQEHRSSNLILSAEHGEEMTIEGTVEEPVRVRDGFSRMAVRVDSAARGGEEIERSGKLLVLVYSHPRVFGPGERLLFRARLRPFRNFNNPGRYDYELATRTKGFVCAASVSDGRSIVPLGKGTLGFVQDTLESMRDPLRRFMQEKLWPHQAALFRALILGETQDMGPELRELFTSTGLGHVLAVSGLNIGFVAWLVFFLVKRLLSLSYRWTLRTDIRKAAALITCIPVVGYSLLAGFEVSVQRALVMVLAYLLSVVLGREDEVWSTLGFAALLILAVHPHEFYSISFQLSFGGVIGLLVLLPRFNSILAGMGEGRLLHYLSGIIMSTVAATLFLLPLLMYYFCRISVVTVPANLLVLPFMGIWILPLGLLAAVVLPLSGFIAGLLLQLGSWGIDLSLMIMQFFSGFEWADVWVIRPSVLEIILCYATLLCVLLLNSNRGRWAKVVLLLLVAFLAGDALYWIHETQFNSRFKVTYLDVGAGSAAMIQFPGRERMLIDGGGSAREDFDVGKMVVAPSLLALKIRRVDYLVLSHPEADHMNGLRFIASHFSPRELWQGGYRVDNDSFRQWEEVVRSNGIKERLPLELKDPIIIGGVRIELIHPYPDGKELDFPPTLRLNDRSMVLKFTHGVNSFLFPGDLQKEGEDIVISRRGKMIESDVLLVPHHGSRGSCSREFLEFVNPQLCVISAMGGIPLRFPHPDLLERLEEKGCGILRTDRVGAIHISSDGERLEVETFLGNSLRKRLLELFSS